MAKKILVTGGAGFIGSHLVDELLLQGHEVIALDNLRNGSKENLQGALTNSNFNFIEGDILDKAVCNESLKNTDVVYHLACLGVRHSIHSPVENHEVNATGTLNMLEAVRKNQVKKFFYISTSEIYGKTERFPIVETNVTKPTTVYGSSKLAGEHYTNSYNEAYGLDTTVIRIFNNYGPRAHYEGDSGEVIPRTIVNTLYGKPPVIFGDGSITRDFFYVKDTARILTELMNYKELTGQTFNLGTGVEITIKTLLENLLKLMPENEVEIQYLEDRPADVPRLWVDPSKLRSIVNFKNEYTFEEGLNNTIDYYKNLMHGKDLTTEIPLLNWTK